MTLPITIIITATAGDQFRAETPGGPVEARTLRELGERLRDFLANLEDESASDLVELARVSRSATDQAALLELARTSPPPDACSAATDRVRRRGRRHAMSMGFFYWSCWLPAARIPGKSLQVAPVCWLLAGWRRSADFELALEGSVAVVTLPRWPDACSGAM
jgi:hypothetical protein